MERDIVIQKINKVFRCISRR